MKHSLIVPNFLHKYTTNGTKLCQESMNDIRTVDSCPTSKEEMENAAHNKNCTKFARNKNCTHLEYHCVINTYMNETLEVCALTRFIFGNVEKIILFSRFWCFYFFNYHIYQKGFQFLGYCAEFNAVGGVMQRHYAAKCNDIFPKCDRIYSSKYAYKCAFKKKFSTF